MEDEDGDGDMDGLGSDEEEKQEEQEVLWKRISWNVICLLEQTGLLSVLALWFLILEQYLNIPLLYSLKVYSDFIIIILINNFYGLQSI